MYLFMNTGEKPENNYCVFVRNPVFLVKVNSIIKK